MTLYELSGPVRVGFACNAETYERMANDEAVAALTELGSFAHMVREAAEFGQRRDGLVIGHAFVGFCVAGKADANGAGQFV